MTSWPPNYRSEYLKRYNLLRACGTDSALQQVLMKHYDKNPMDWINDWGITYDPRVRSASKVMPFMMFQRQSEFITFLHGCVTDKECGLVEKSRDVGATWLCCAYSVWLWLFTPGASVGWGSRKELLVDRLGDPDSIFEKMRMLLENLPAWMLPKGFHLRTHATYMKIINPLTGATITGESGASIGRGGRSQVYFKDESAHYERPELIEASLGDNTDVQIDISSVHGTANVFYRRRMAGEEWMPDKTPTKGKTRVFVFDWRNHPGKTQDWYDRRRAKAESEGLLHLLAQEVDRDYAASVDRVIIPMPWIKAAIDAHIKLGFGDDGKKIAGLDVADEGGDKNALAIRHGVILKLAEHWGEGDTGVTARRAIQQVLESACAELYYDSIGVGATVKAETNRLKKEGHIPQSLKILPWNAGASPNQPEDRLIPGDANSPKNNDFFSNMKAQGWWNLRCRFEKTHRAVTQGVKYDPAELISLPSELSLLHEIELELSQATQQSNGKGKLVVDKKPDGAKSPNLADAIVMCYMPARKYAKGEGYLEWMEGHMRRVEASGDPNHPDPRQRPGFIDTRC
jgi:phage terminase large subunit